MMRRMRGDLMVPKQHASSQCQFCEEVDGVLAAGLQSPAYPMYEYEVFIFAGRR